MSGCGYSETANFLIYRNKNLRKKTKIKQVIISGNLEDVQINNNIISSTKPFTWFISDSAILYIVPINKQEPPKLKLVIRNIDFQIKSISNQLSNLIKCNKLYIKQTNKTYHCKKHPEQLCITWDQGKIFFHKNLVEDLSKYKFYKNIPNQFYFEINNKNNTSNNFL